MKKKKSKIIEPIELTCAQLSHIIRGSIKNLVDLEIHHEEELGIHKFLIVVDCLYPEECIAANIEPETDEQIENILFAHSVSPLSNFFEAILSMRKEESKSYRGFSTIAIDQENMPEFLSALSELDDYWFEVGQDIEEEMDFKAKTKGKNVVEGNDTVN